MIKFASNFCYCAVDQENAVFQWKRAVSGPSALLGPEMIKFASNFCYCAVDQEKTVFSMETGRFWPICPFGARNGQICFEFLLLCCRSRKNRFFNGNGPFLAHLPFWGPKWSNLHRTLWQNLRLRARAGHCMPKASPFRSVYPK